MGNNKKDGNISSKESKHRKWSKKEMDEAKPFPIPEVDEDKKEDKANHNDKNSES